MTESTISVSALHTSEAIDLLAAWRVAERKLPYDWDSETEMTRYLPAKDPSLNGLVALLDSAGIGPDVISHGTHTEIWNRLRLAASSWSLPDAASAFVASLWSAPGTWRSALPGVLLAHSAPEHEIQPWSESSPELCELCGYRGQPAQVTSEWAFRMAGTTPLDGDPAGYGLALSWLGSERPAPTEYDLWALGAVRAVIMSLPPGTRHSKAAAALKAAKIIQGDSREYVNFLEALALVGVLAPTDHPGLAERFTSYRERDQRPNTRVECQAPLAWWDTSVGTNGWRDDVFEQLFGHLDVPVVDLDAPRPTPVPVASATTLGGLPARVRALTTKAQKVPASIGDGPAAVGDVWAVRVRPDAWVTVYVHAIHTERERPYAQVEYLAGVFSEFPRADQVTLAGQPRHDGRDVQYVHSLEKTPWIRRIAQGLPEPQANEPLPDRGGWQAAKQLQWLASWNFTEL